MSSQYYIVTIDRPYYPSVEYFDNIEDARREYLEALNEHEDDGTHDTIVCLATVSKHEEIKTYY